MHPLLHPAGCIVPCIIVCQISQLSPHALIQSMRTSFCIYRLINRQNTCYNYQRWDIDARNGPHGVILSTVSSRSPALFSLFTAAFRGRNQRFIKKCTLLWTIAGYRPQCEVSSKVMSSSACWPCNCLPASAASSIHCPQMRTAPFSAYRPDCTCFVLWCIPERSSGTCLNRFPPWIGRMPTPGLISKENLKQILVFVPAVVYNIFVVLFSCQVNYITQRRICPACGLQILLCRVGPFFTPPFSF